MLTKQNSVGFAVLALVFSKLEEDEIRNLLVEPYLNGRESGFAIQFPERNCKLAFSEDRNSDSIIVYNGLNHEFSMQGNVPSDSVWKNSKHYAGDAIYLAADLVVEQLRKT